MPGPGREENDDNYQAIATWAASKTDDDFRQMVFRGSLNRSDIVKECGFARSVLTQNPRVKAFLEALEHDLRSRSVLPPLEEKAPDSGLPMRPAGSGKAVMNEQRLKHLEEQNAALKAENKDMKEKLARYGLLEEALAETGRIPR